MNKYKFEEIDGINELRETNMLYLKKALSRLDKNIVDKIREEVLFSDTDVSTYPTFHIYLNSNHLKEKKSLIVLSENLKEITEEEAIKIILHEVAHYYLGHKGIFDFPLEEISRYYEQEQEANKQVEEWLR